MASPADPRTRRTQRTLFNVPWHHAASAVTALLVGAGIMLVPENAQAEGPCSRRSACGGITAVAEAGGNLTMDGWASATNSTSPVQVMITTDGQYSTRVVADGSSDNLPGPSFRASWPSPGGGTHTVCATLTNYFLQIGCVTVGSHSPTGTFTAADRTADGRVSLTADATDPDTGARVPLSVKVDGVAAGTGTGPGFAIAMDGDAHTVCLTAVNTGLGQDTDLGCHWVPAVPRPRPVPPSQPTSVRVAAVTTSSITVAWLPPTNLGNSPITGYEVSVWPEQQQTRDVGAAARSVTLGSLRAGTTYWVTVEALNAAGASDPAVVDATTKRAATPKPPTTPTAPKPKPTTTPTTTKAPAPQRTVPRPSTSRYTRNLHNSVTSDVAAMRAEGAADAAVNPSGHSYVVLLDIGGQTATGVSLTTGVRFVSYPALVASLRAYVAGYHSRQRKSAPVTIALGTNNDMVVSAATGRLWATKVVHPVASFAAQYAGITIAGANDIEPGFRAGYKATAAWLSGYLAATKAKFIFNGSADGCSQSKVGGKCNRGWTQAGLYRLAAGAAPKRIIALPQIYFHSMTRQWRWISRAGVARGGPRITFGGVLTESTACKQARSCSSMGAQAAWKDLWTTLRSDSRVAVSTLPWATDLRIDKAAAAPAPKPTTASGISEGINATPAQAQAIGKALMVARGEYSASNWSCLVNLWNGESGWRVHAQNPKSGAYGIPQALPATKLATAGSNWRDSAKTQISWGLAYIRNRYGSACGAWTFWQKQSPHWY